MFVTRIAVTALTAAAIFAPSASAMILTDGNIHSQSPAVTNTQDLPRAGLVAPRSLPSSVQDLRSADSRDTADGIVVSHVQPVGVSSGSSDSFPWVESGAAFALLLLVGGVGAAGVRTARSRRSDQPLATS